MPPQAASEMKDSLPALYEAHEGKVSDKWASYLTLYDAAFTRFRDRPIRILEIGIQNGGSLEIWARFFPNAQKIVGCDIDDRCRLLAYDDARIAVVVGDANEPDILDRITAISDEYDIIIDDGSHMSRDIVRSFGMYFPLLATHGLYVAEDLHCSYWDRFEGGIEAPYSSIAFFKRLADYVNQQHWGASVPRSEMLSFFGGYFGAAFGDASLSLIDEVVFRNSVVIVSKGKLGANLLGSRIVVGQTAIVDPSPKEGSGQSAPATDQSQNQYGPLAERSESLLMNLPRRVVALEEALAERNLKFVLMQEEALRLAAHANSVQARLAVSQAELAKVRQNPHKALADKIGFHALRGLAKSPLPFPSRMRARFARSAAKRDPERKA